MECKSEFFLFNERDSHEGRPFNQTDKKDNFKLVSNLYTR